jgi:hypothetical protein
MAEWSVIPELKDALKRQMNTGTCTFSKFRACQAFHSYHHMSQNHFENIQQTGMTGVIALYIFTFTHHVSNELITN